MINTGCAGEGSRTRGIILQNISQNDEKFNQPTYLSNEFKILFIFFLFLKFMRFFKRAE